MIVRTKIYRHIFLDVEELSSLKKNDVRISELEVGNEIVISSSRKIQKNIRTEEWELAEIVRNHS